MVLATRRRLHVSNPLFQRHDHEILPRLEATMFLSIPCVLSDVEEIEIEFGGKFQPVSKLRRRRQQRADAACTRFYSRKHRQNIGSPSLHAADESLTKDARGRYSTICHVRKLRVSTRGPLRQTKVRTLALWTSGLSMLQRPIVTVLLRFQATGVVAQDVHQCRHKVEQSAPQSCSWRRT